MSDAPPTRSRPGWLDVLAAGFAPGALFGTQLAGLIFFLNPGLPFAPWPVARGIAVYAFLLGAVSLAVHLPLTFGRPRRARRWLPWALTMILAGAALLDWTHASRFAYYLPPGINDRLIRTALWLTLGMLISFYTALLHTLHRRRYGWRSRYGLALLAVLSVFAMLERRDAFRPRRGPAPRPAAVEAGQRPRLLVIGIDTATFDAVLPLASQGRLPFIASLLQRGAYGRLESIAPPQRDALWMSLATGKYPYKHGVTGGRIYPADWIAPGAELRILPEGIAFGQWGVLGRRPSTPRIYPQTALPLWEILPRLGVPSGVVGWPASGTAAGTTFSLSDRFFFGEAEPGSTRPPDLAERARLLRVEPPRSTAACAPASAPVQPARRPRCSTRWRPISGGSRSFSHCSSSTRRPEPGSWCCPGCARSPCASSAPFLPSTSTARATPPVRGPPSGWGGITRGSTIFWPRSGSMARVLASWQWSRPAAWPAREPRERSSEAPDGILLLYGEGIRPGALLTGARLVDLTPTLLYALGFPSARDLDGQVLTAAFDKRFLAGHPLTFFPSYEALAPAEPQLSRPAGTF